MANSGRCAIPEPQESTTCRQAYVCFLFRCYSEPDYYLGRDFADSVQLMGLDWACTRQDGFIADQQNGKFCVFQIGE